ncbi:hypothetical protein P154DRAFT_597209 [Amniculicola lignicola CBS 123094]|uniref:Uncharacterized protein n=1 Tax=Amniculicola lignicola CBS 123094 TaxID=1392246 RepID=A0A6A5WYN3_9PLEO|nr:hypothetical protein P154DRAFT_597209 [Amniculicola lignicola CBS 123094]
MRASSGTGRWMVPLGPSALVSRETLFGAAEAFETARPLPLIMDGSGWRDKGLIIHGREGAPQKNSDSTNTKPKRDRGFSSRTAASHNAGSSKRARRNSTPSRVQASGQKGSAGGMTVAGVARSASVGWFRHGLGANEKSGDYRTPVRAHPALRAVHSARGVVEVEWSWSRCGRVALRDSGGRATASVLRAVAVAGCCTAMFLEPRGCCTASVEPSSNGVLRGLCAPATAAATKRCWGGHGGAVQASADGPCRRPRPDAPFDEGAPHSPPASSGGLRGRRVEGARP